ncbi:protein ORD [Drosophila grimshawi]|uniref:GH23052 n=1 Tax=Drosophila grimshawi TaxID=7222 RepID=B4JWJ1_DROGR|nr:protein ORD [Drosophila grimshawi]EDV98329.1 GH23052 [Drosophila grimshawi]
MAGNCGNTKLHILSLTIEECLGCKSANVTFRPVDNAHLVIYTLEKPNETNPMSPIMVTPVGNALKLMCTMDFPDAASLQRMPQLNIGRGCVKMTFKLERLDGICVVKGDADMTPTTSKQAEEHQRARKQSECARRHTLYEVNVQRRFDRVEQLNRIHFQTNGGNWRELTVEEFHGIFFVQPPHRYELLPTQMHQRYAHDWLKTIQADTNNYNILSEDGNPFDTFAKLFDRQDSEQHKHLERLATNCLSVNETARLSERRFLLSIFKQTRSIFEYITNYEYTVWFFVPRHNRYMALNSLSLDDFDLSNVRTCIKLTRDESNRFWQRADHNIMDILLVSIQMALAQTAKQSLLFLGQLEKLSEFVCMQYVTAYFMNTMYTAGSSNTQSSTPKWVCSRYLNRIIQMAESMDLIVVIEYPCTLTLMPNNHRHVKCKQQLDKKTGAISWHLSMDVTKTVDNGIKLLSDAMNSN